MSHCQCTGIERTFDQRLAASQLEKSRRRGPARTTRLLLEALLSGGVAGKSLLDVGGGVGLIQHEMLRAGVTQVTAVDAASAYIEAARSEAERLGAAARVRFLLGNFVDLAPRVPDADIVTLDRVICCYDDMHALVDASAAKAKSVYGLVYPRRTWWTRLGVALMNAVQRAQGNTFRVYVHNPAAVDASVRAHGLSGAYHRNAGLWQVVVYTREGNAA